MSVTEARERARRALTETQSPLRQALARDVLALSDENERLLEDYLDLQDDSEDAHAEVERAVAEAATLREALERIAAHEYATQPIGDPVAVFIDGEEKQAVYVKKLHPYEIARAALAATAGQEPA